MVVFEAYNLAEGALNRYARAVRWQQLLGLCPAELGRTEQVRQRMEVLYNIGHQDSETAGILRRIFKDLLNIGESLDAQRRRSEMGGAVRCRSHPRRSKIHHREALLRRG